MQTGTSTPPGHGRRPRQASLSRRQTVPPQDRPPAASPSNILDREIVAEPPFLDPQQRQEAGRMNQVEAAELAGVLVPPVDLQNDTEAYGYPKGSRVYKINMQQAWLLALMNARFYQYNLEQVYLAAIPVTQQRFSFGPQFYAGMSPATSPLTPGSRVGQRQLPVDAGRQSPQHLHVCNAVLAERPDLHS